MANNVKCPECGATTRIWAKGLVPSRTGPKQRYVCFACGKTFYKAKVEAKPAKVARTRKAKSSKKSH